MEPSEPQSTRQCCTAAPPLIPPYGISQPEPTWSAIPGSSPAWHRCNMQTKGRTHVPETHPSFLKDTKLVNWGSADPLPDPHQKKHVKGPQPRAVITQPVALNGNREYYKRRQHTPDDADPQASAHVDSLYRRVLKYVPEPQRDERPEGRRHVSLPVHRLQHSGTIKLMPAMRNAPAKHAPEPDIPRMRRCELARTLQDRGAEQSLEESMQCIGKVGPQDFRGTGRAGDLSDIRLKHNTAEDTPGFFAKLQESPTYIRYCKSLPPSAAVSPQQRRAAAEQQMHMAETLAEARLVQSLPGLE